MCGVRRRNTEMRHLQDTRKIGVIGPTLACGVSPCCPFHTLNVFDRVLSDKLQERHR